MPWSIWSRQSAKSGLQTWSYKRLPGRGEIAISLIIVESSLMARSNSLLTRKTFPVRTRREFPRMGLKLMSYIDAFAWPERPNPTKFPVFSPASRELDARKQNAIAAATD
jgi:hypothetical protein